MTTITYNGKTVQAVEAKGAIVRKSNGWWTLDNTLKDALKNMQSPVQVVILIPQK